MRLRKQRRWASTALLVALLLATQVLWVGAPARAQGLDDRSVRLSGYILSKDPTQWLIGSGLEGYRKVNIYPETTIRRGLADVGALVTVFALQTPAGELNALVIQVEREAGAPGLPVQLTGIITKIGAGWWQIDGDTPIQVTPQTQIIGMPQIGSLAQVSTTMTYSGLWAEWIHILVDGPTYEFRGVLKEIGLDYRIIDDKYVAVPYPEVIVGVEEVGAIVDCRAKKREDGILEALLLRVVPPTERVRIAGILAQIPNDNPTADGTWQVSYGSEEGSAELQTAKVEVNQNTWVDETRAVVTTGQWVELRAEQLKPDVYQASVVRVERGPQTGVLRGVRAQGRAGISSVPWGAPATVATRLGVVDHPAVAFTPDGVAHAVWEENDYLFYARQAPGEVWSPPEGITFGFAPDMIAEDNGTLHVTFVNNFNGKHDVFYVARRDGRWTPAVNMSYTAGYAAAPKLALSRNHVLHAVFQDNTSGQNVVHYASWNGSFWSHRPVPSGRGEAPSIAIASDDTIYVAWQDRVSPDGDSVGAVEVFVTQFRANNWDAPLEISDVDGLNSLAPHLATTSDNMGQVVWVDDERDISYSYGQGRYWSEPVVISSVAGYARRAQVAVENGTFLHVAWDEEFSIRVASAEQRTSVWPPIQTLDVDDRTEVKDLYLAPNPLGGAGLAWARDAGDNYWSIFTSAREPLAALALPPQIWIPLFIWAPNWGGPIVP